MIVSRQENVVATVMLVLAMPIAGFIALSMLTAPSSRRPSPSWMCHVALQRIAFGFQNYHAQYGVLPPAVAADENGRPMHSWRALISHYPDIGRYRLDEPWDGPRNIHVINDDDPNRPYRCTSASNANPCCANYVVVVGDETAFPGSRSVALDLNQNDTGSSKQTILVVEIADSDILWTEPRDLPYDGLTRAVGGDHHQVSSQHGASANAIVYESGGKVDEKLKVIQLPKRTPVESLRKMCLLPGGE